MLRTHYRQPIDWTVKALEEAEKTLDRWYDAIGEADPADEIADSVMDALDDDLNTPAAISELHRLASPEVLKASANILGLLMQTRSEMRRAAGELAPSESARVEIILAARASARANKDWAESDRLRDELAKMGVAIKDNKNGPTTWEVKR
jgi:cysteinyl-tRNA synthetase